MARRILGTSKITTDNKITIIEPVAELMKIKKGDSVVYFLEESGKITIEKS